MDLYISGDSELEKGNKNIRKHDNLVIDYNKLVTKIDILQEE